ncbi:MAG TPA: ABC transporter ATP-binding protein [Terriglobales bacterium]|nr:ABC transporter ATP-binding protein [Terriglobales bacterium]
MNPPPVAPSPETTTVVRPVSVALESVSKVFRHRPALLNWIGRERGGETRALDDVSLSAAPGEVLVLVGPNGSGKTTLLKLVSTMLLPDKGQVEVAGADTVREAARARRAVGFAVAAERSFYPRLTARENLAFFAALDDVLREQRRERVEWALEKAGLTEAGDTLVMKFSSGMYQRLGIARALLKRPTVLLLDEPTRSLDPAAASRFWTLVRETADAGATILLTTHRFDEAMAVGDAVAVLARGVLAGQHRLGAGVSLEELRAFYFRETEDESPAGAGKE